MPPKYYKSLEKLKDPQIKRLSEVAGIGRISKDVYPEIKGSILIFLQDILRFAIAMTEHNRLKTVKDEYINAAYHSLTGNKFYGGFDNRPVCKIYHAPQTTRKKNPVDVMLRRIKFYRNQSDCFFLAKSVVEKLIKQVAYNFNTDIRFTKGSIYGIQSMIEYYIIQIFDKARDVAQIRGAVTVTSEDIKMGSNFCGPNHIRTL